MLRDRAVPPVIGRPLSRGSRPNVIDCRPSTIRRMSESVQRRAFDAFAERARERLDGSLRRLVLYGSVARGEERPDSDVDVFAVVGRPSDKRVLHDVAFDVELEYEVAISLIVRTPDEYGSMEGSRFAEEVARGVAVV